MKTPRLPAPRVALLALLLAAPAAAQGTLPQNEAFHYVLTASEPFGGPCTTGPFSASIEVGMLDLQASGTWNTTANEKIVCPGGSSTVSSDPTGGTYTLSSDGTLTLTVSPTEVLDLALRFDHRLLTNGPSSPNFSGLLLGIRQATSTPPLAGTYQVVRFVQRHAPTGLVVVLEVGTLTVGAGGSWSESGQRHLLAPTGTTDGPYATSGTLAATSNGALTVQPGGRAGAASATGDLLFWEEDLGFDAGVTIALRRDGAHTAAALGGSWTTIAHGAEQGPASDLPRAWGFGALGSISGTTGAATFVGTGLEVDASGGSPTTVTEAGTLTTTANGDLTWTSSASPGPPFPGLLARNEAFAVLGDVASPGSAEVVFLWQRCVAPVAYGVGTPGTLGVTPQLSSTGGMPFSGNSVFALRVQQGVGGGNGLLLVTGQPAPGLPLAGGTLWVGGAALVFQAFTLSGPAGAPGGGSVTVPLPIPSGSALVGLDLYGQAAVFDGGAVGGLSLTEGLAFEICE